MSVDLEKGETRRPTYREPAEFDFVINLTTVQALGSTIPQSILAQVTEGHSVTATISVRPQCCWRPIRRASTASGLLIEISLLAACAGRPGESAAPPEPSPMARIGVLLQADGGPNDPNLEAFRQGLREYGYVEDQNVALG